MLSGAHLLQPLFLYIPGKHMNQYIKQDGNQKKPTNMQ